MSDKISKAKQEGKEAAFEVGGRKVLFSDLLAKMSEVDSYDFQKQYKNSERPMVDLDEQELVSVHKN